MRELTRREALKTATAIVSGALLTSSAVLAACAREARQAATGILADDDRALAEEIADTMLPATAASPGAKAAGAGAAMNLLLTDCYDADAQRKVVAFLSDFRARCRDRCGGDFSTLAPRERERVLREVDAEARKGGPTHPFELVRELAMRAYFSSEIGMTRALRYLRVPGRWVGCVPLAPGQPAWG